MGTARRRGGAAIEFALVLPVFTALLFGIMEYGWAFMEQGNIVAAVREGARLGVTYSTTGSTDPRTAATARVRTVLNQYGLDGTGASVTSAYSGTSPSEVLVVTAVVPYSPLIGLVAVPDNLHGTMTMLLEQQP